MRLGLSNSEFDTLYAICELGDGCKQSDICRTTFIPKQTVNSAIRSLQKKEYLTLASGKGRSMHIYLTEQGLQLVRRTIFPMVEIENEAFPKLTEKEIQNDSAFPRTVSRSPARRNPEAITKLEELQHEDTIIRTFYL